MYYYNYNNKMKKNKVSPLDFNSLIPSKLNDTQYNSSYNYNKFSMTNRTEGNNDSNYNDTGRSVKSNDDYNYNNKKNSNNNNNKKKIPAKKVIKYNIKDNKFNKMSSKKLLVVPTASASKLSYNSSPSMNILDDFNSNFNSEQEKVKNKFEYISKKENPKHLRNDLVKLNSEKQFYKEDIQKSSKILFNLQNELASLTSKINEEESPNRKKEDYKSTYESDDSDSYYLGNKLKNQQKLRIHSPPQTVNSEDEFENNEIDSRSGLIVNSENIILVNKIETIEKKQIHGFQNINKKISDSQQILNDLIQNQNELELNIIKLKEDKASKSFNIDLDESKINNFSKEFDLMKEENKSIKLILQSEITRTREIKNNINDDILKWTEGERSFKKFIKSEIDILKNANSGNGHEFPLPLFLTSRIEKIENNITKNNDEIDEIRLLQDELIKESEENQQNVDQLSRYNEEFMSSSTEHLNSMKEDIMSIFDKKFTKQFNGMKILNEKIKETQTSIELIKSSNKNQVKPLDDENIKEIKNEVIPIVSEKNINRNLLINSQYVASAISDIILLKKYLKIVDNDNNDKVVSFIDELNFEKKEKEKINSFISKPLSIFIEDNNNNNNVEENRSNLEEYKLNLEQYKSNLDSYNNKLSGIEIELEKLKENVNYSSSSVTSSKPEAKDAKFKEFEESLKLLITSSNEETNVFVRNITDKTIEQLENYKDSINLELKSLHADLNEIKDLRGSDLINTINKSEKLESIDNTKIDASLNSFKMELDSLSIEVNKLKDLQTTTVSYNKENHDESEIEKKKNDNVERIDVEVKNLVKKVDEIKNLISKTNSNDIVNNDFNKNIFPSDNLKTELKTLQDDVDNIKISLTDEMINKTKLELHDSIEKMKSDILEELDIKDNSNNNNNNKEILDSIEQIKSDLLEQIRIEEETRKEEIKIGKDYSNESNINLENEINRIRELIVSLKEEKEKLKEENSQELKKLDLKIDALNEENSSTKNMLLNEIKSFQILQTIQNEKLSNMSTAMEERFKLLEEKNIELVEQNLNMNIEIEKLQDLKLNAEKLSDEVKNPEDEKKAKSGWGKIKNLTLNSPKKSDKSITKKIDKLRSKEKEMNKERSEYKRQMKELLQQFTDEYNRQPTDAELDQPKWISFKIVIYFIFYYNLILILFLSFLFIGPNE